ncbi:MAG: TolC family protein [Gammaproteobacteria bacterium]|nr:TolC family protein [Gammaproteobacteria bacterium]
MLRILQKTPHGIQLFMLLSLSAFSSQGVALELTIKDAEGVAIQNDPLIIKHQAKASSYMEESVSDSQWPDPRLKFGLANVPISGFSLEKEAMTQTVIGVQQAIPRGGILDQKKEKKLLLAEVERAESMSRALHVLRNLRKAWMDVYYYDQALALVKESEDVFTQLVKITQYQYRAGRGKQQNVVSAQLEKSLLSDKETFFQQMKQTSVAELEKWTGASIKNHDLSPFFPELATLPTIEELTENIEFHPSVAAKKAGLGASRKEVAIMKENFKPSWMVDVNYGLRLGENVMKDAEGNDVVEKRSDLFSAMVSVDLPFFTEKRQDKRLNARGYDVNAASDAVDAHKRELKRILDSSYANWQFLGERLEFYKTTVLPQAAQYAESSRKAYQSQVSDFADLVRSRLRQLDSNLLALKIRVDRTKAHYDLQYIAGEEL